MFHAARVFRGRKIDLLVPRLRCHMSKIQWEYDLVERPFCEQLQAMGWQWIEGDRSGLMTGRLTGRVRVPATLDSTTKTT